MKFTDLIKLSMDDLRNLNSQVVAAMKHKQAELTLDYKVGDVVSFNAGSRGRLTGTVMKVNHKTIQVKTPNISYRVAPSLLTKA